MTDLTTPDYANTPVSPTRPPFGYSPADGSTAPYVTVVTPFFNAGADFHETAASVFKQSFQQWEWLIINDGSTDRQSHAILDAYRNCDARVHVIDLDANRGPGAARNCGFERAQADYVVQLDADDLLETTAIEKWLWHLESNTEYGFVSSYSVGFGAEQYLWERGFHDGPAAYLLENLGTTRAMVRKSVHAAAHGYDASITAGLEDWDFWLRCAAAGFWGDIVPEYLDWYRRRPNHGDKWPTWDSGDRQRDFRNQLRARHSDLWNGALPSVSRWHHTAKATVSDELPCQNLLRKEKPRALVVLPWLAAGGADKFNLDLLEQLASNGWEVTIATTLAGDYACLAQFARHTPDIFMMNHFLRLTDYPRFLRYLISSRQSDAVLISNTELGYLLLPYLRAHCPHAVFVDFCRSNQDDWKNGGYPGMAVEYQELLDLNIVSSAHLKQWMAGRGADPRRIELCYTNVAATDTAPAHDNIRARVRSELGLHNHIPVVLYEARLWSEKQLRVLVRTLTLLQDHSVDFAAVVAGDGSESRQQKADVRSARLGERVLLLGAVTNERLTELMMAADIFFLPSQRDGIALTLFEAMANGLPIVAADVGGRRELVTVDCGVLIAASDPEDEARRYADVLGQLLRDPTRRLAMGEAGRTRVREHFRSEEMGKRMVALFGKAKELHEVVPRPTPSLGLGRACATEAIEYTRLSEVADRLWDMYRSEGADSGRASWRIRTYRLLVRLGYPLYSWGMRQGFTWLPPLRETVERVLLHPVPSGHPIRPRRSRWWGSWKPGWRGREGSRSGVAKRRP